MKRIATFAAMLVLAACGAKTEEPKADSAAAPAAAPAMEAPAPAAAPAADSAAKPDSAAMAKPADTTKKM